MSSLCVCLSVCVYLFRSLLRMDAQPTLLLTSNREKFGRLTSTKAYCPICGEVYCSECVCFPLDMSGAAPHTPAAHHFSFFGKKNKDIMTCEPCFILIHKWMFDHELENTRVCVVVVVVVVVVGFM